MKHIIIITIAVLLIIFVGLVVYNLFLKDRAGNGTSVSFFRSPESFNTGFGAQQEEQLVQITKEPIAGFRVNRGNIVTVSTRGAVNERAFTGEVIKELANLNTEGVVEARVSPAADKAALKIVDLANGQERWLIFDGVKLVNLPPNSKEVSFSPEGKILSLRGNNGKIDIVVTGETKEKTVLTTSIPDLTASWLDEETIALSTKPSGLAAGILYFLDTERGRLSRLTGGRHGLTTLVSPKKDKVIFSETNSKGRGLAIKILDRTKNSEISLPLNTLPERCLFSQDNRTIFCATFPTSPATVIMPDEYHKGAFGTETSTIFKVNLETSNTNVVAQNLEVDAILPQLSNDEQYLFFINKKDGTLYRIKLN